MLNDHVRLRSPRNTVPAFDRYIGIDYSGAKTPSASLSGLRVHLAERESEPTEVLPPKYWTRRGVAEWLVEKLSEERRTLIGIDHGFSFPSRYFEEHSLPHNWPAFLDDFQKHWPTDGNIYADFVRDGITGNGKARGGDSRWRRLTEIRAVDVPALEVKEKGRLLAQRPAQVCTPKPSMVGGSLFTRGGEKQAEGIHTGIVVFGGNISMEVCASRLGEDVHAPVPEPVVFSGEGVSIDLDFANRGFGRRRLSCRSWTR